MAHQPGCSPRSRLAPPRQPGVSTRPARLPAGGHASERRVQIPPSQRSGNPPVPGRWRVRGFNRWVSTGGCQPAETPDSRSEARRPAAPTMAASSTGPSDETGKRDGLKNHCPQGLAGSSPASGTPAPGRAVWGSSPCVLVTRRDPFSLLLGVALTAGAVVWWRNRMLAANSRRSPETSNPPVTGLNGVATRPAVTSARPPGSDPL